MAFPTASPPCFSNLHHHTGRYFPLLPPAYFYYIHSLGESHFLPMKPYEPLSRYCSLLCVFSLFPKTAPNGCSRFAGEKRIDRSEQSIGSLSTPSQRPTGEENRKARQHCIKPSRFGNTAGLFEVHMAAFQAYPPRVGVAPTRSSAPLDLYSDRKPFMLTLPSCTSDGKVSVKVSRNQLTVIAESTT